MRVIQGAELNNFLEAAGENVLWGGGRADTTLSDIEFRHNYVSKPLTWWHKHPSFFGTQFAVKNLYETKNSIRELIEGNIFENNWAQSQKGTAILLYPKNQYGQCPSCVVRDLTFRYNIVRHTVNGIGIAATDATTCRGGRATVDERAVTAPAVLNFLKYAPQITLCKRQLSLVRAKSFAERAHFSAENAPRSRCVPVVRLVSRAVDCAWIVSAERVRFVSSTRRSNVASLRFCLRDSRRDNGIAAGRIGAKLYCLSAGWNE